MKDNTGVIRHTVQFRLSHAEGSAEEKAFISDGVRILSAVPGVRHFAVLRQVSAKNPYRFLFTMEFEGEGDYRRYNNHPDHTAFVRDRWEKEVEAFLEADYTEADEG